MHLLSTIDSRFVVPFRVMVHSLGRCRRSTAPISWHVLESGLTPEDKRAIEAQVEGTPIDVVWHRRADERSARLPIWGRAVPAMYDRIFAAHVLPESIGRMIYLDADLLFLADIDSLWSTDITGHVIGAVQDAVIPSVSSPLGLKRHRELGFQPTDPYFNAGVLLVDLDAWREGKVEEDAIDYMERHSRSINLADQDVLNAVLHGRWTRLDDRWNIIGGSAGRPHFNTPGIAPPRMTAALDEPAIIHFAGYLKPWLYSDLGSRWSDVYTRTLCEVFPEYRFTRSLRAASVGFYDRHLRTSMYPLERLAWRASRYLQ